MERALLSGNEAIARGFWEAGGHVACAYPGTPSTEILENITRYDDVYCQWNCNEKTAFETAAGSSVAGARTLVAMKHVGLNVAADPMMTMAYTGVNGGFVIVTADDPGMHSSQNEQDNRRFAMFAKIPVLNPSDSQEALDFVKLGFDISERFDVPVMLRITTRIAHSKTLVDLSPRKSVPVREYRKNIKKNLVIPANARVLHTTLEKRLADLADWAAECPANSLELAGPAKPNGEQGSALTGKGAGETGNLGVVTSGIAYQYAREIYPEASFLKVGMDFPFPIGLARRLNEHCEEILVIEELEPVLEEALVMAGIKVTGKAKVPICGELDQRLLAEALGETVPDMGPGLPQELPGRPPVLCPGCSHRPLFLALKKMKLTVHGDIGCYTLGALPPLDAMDTCICMGASITENLGFELARGAEFSKQSVAVIGDSTFFHSGMTGLLDVVYNGAHSTVIILDNDITAMTGHQDNPGTGRTLMGKTVPRADIPGICRALGVEKVEVLNPYDLDNNLKVLRECLDYDGPSVIVAKAPCMLIGKHRVTRALEVDPSTCKKCGACVRTGCPAVSRSPEGHAEINPMFCAGEICSLCRRVCKFNAHRPPRDNAVDSTAVKSGN